MKRIRVVVADDHTIVRDGLVSLLAEQPEFVVVGQAGDGPQAVQAICEHEPEVAVVDLSLPRLGGLEVIRRVHEQCPAVKLLVLTMHTDEEYVLPAVRAGASGYLVKDSAAAELVDAVRALAAGRVYFGPQAAAALAREYREPGSAPADPYGRLTRREREVFHLVAEGLSTKEIARTLGIQPKTAENHRSRVMEKLGCHNTAEVVRYAAQKGLL